MPRATSPGCQRRQPFASAGEVPAGSRDLLQRQSRLCLLHGYRLLEYGLARELDAVVVVDADDLDVQDVAELADVGDAVDVAVVELADVAQSVAAGHDL